MAKLIVEDSCIGCGSCVAIDSEHFDFDDNGQSVVIKNDNLDTNELKNAIASCPVSAIKLEGAKGKDDEDCGCGDECKCGDDCKCGSKCACHKN